MLSYNNILNSLGDKLGNYVKRHKKFYLIRAKNCSAESAVVDCVLW
jgi:hypothetical protein